MKTVKLRRNQWAPLRGCVECHGTGFWTNCFDQQYRCDCYKQTRAFKNRPLRIEINWKAKAKAYEGVIRRAHQSLVGAGGGCVTLHALNEADFWKEGAK